MTLRADGSGTITARITLDADAVQRLTARATARAGGPARRRARRGLEGLGVDARHGRDGRVPITLTHGFVGPGRSRAPDRQISSARPACLRDPTITRTRVVRRRRTRSRSRSTSRHLSTGIRSDAQLARRLAAAGVDVNALDAQLQSAARRRVAPSSVTVHAPGGQSKTVQLTAGKHATVSASTAQTYTRADPAALDRCGPALARVGDHGSVTCFQVAPASCVMNILPFARMTNPWVDVVNP